MAKAKRTKSINDIIKQAARVEMQIEIERNKRIAQGKGVRGDARDEQLRRRGNNAHVAMWNYTDNLSNKMGVTGWGYNAPEEGRPAPTQAQMDKQFSVNTYKGLVQG